MFQTGLGLLLQYISLYICIPLIPGILASWVLVGKHLQGIRLYLVSRFLGLGVVAYGLFLTQFLYFGVDYIAGSIILAVLVLLFLIKLYVGRVSIKEYIYTLKISILGRSWLYKKDTWYITMVIAMIVLLLGVAITSFMYVSHFPNYGDDAFGNWHSPVMNILYDGGIKMFGATEEILGRGRLGYPIMIPTFKAFISYIAGGFNDIYTNILQRIAAILFLLHSIIFIYQKKQDIRAALMGATLIVSMPLFFLHAVEGYMDLLSAIYAGLAVQYIYEWLQPEGDAASFFLGVTFLGILSYIKNDGFVVYMSSIVISLALYMMIFYKSVTGKLRLFSVGRNRIIICSIILYFIVPFTALKAYYNLGFNQASGESSGVGISDTIHTEIFPAIWHTIWGLNNYSIAPILSILLLLYIGINYKKISRHQWFPIIQFIVLVGVFLAVFLFTDNYKFVLDQTTVNRVFTMTFIILFSSFGLLVDEE